MEPVGTASYEMPGVMSRETFEEGRAAEERAVRIGIILQVIRIAPPVEVDTSDLLRIAAWIETGVHPDTIPSADHAAMIGSGVGPDAAHWTGGPAS